MNCHSLCLDNMVDLSTVLQVEYKRLEKVKIITDGFIWPFATDKRKDYEMKNILERFLISMANHVTERADPVFIDVGADHVVYKTMKHQIFEKGLYTNEATDTLIDETRKLIKEYLDFRSQTSSDFKPVTDNKMKIVRDKRYVSFSYGNFREKLSCERYSRLLRCCAGTLQEQNSRICIMLIRYQCLFPRGQQWAIPLDWYKYLNAKYTVTHEGFASPINSRVILISDTATFSSLFYDTDQYFGSTGNFLTDKRQYSGTVTVNPPYMEDIMESAMKKINEQCKSAEENGIALRFVFCIPHWADSAAFINAKSSAYLRHYQRLEKNEHFVEMLGDKKIRAKFNSAIFVFDTGFPDSNYADVATNYAC